MKKSIIVCIVTFVIYSHVTAQINQDCSGNIGIGVSPNSSYQLQVGNKAYYSGYVGIGTGPSTSYKLKVGGSSYFTGYIGIASSPSSLFKLKVGGNTYISGNTILGRYATSSYRLEVNGTSKFQVGSSSSLIIDQHDAPYSGMIGLRSSGSGDVYLGSASHAFHHLYTWMFYELSDKKFKKNITPYSHTLEKIKQVQAVKYDLRTEEIFKDNPTMASADFKKMKNNVGLIAQDVYELFPEIVDYDDSTDIYSISYSRFIPILIEAVKEQQLIIESLQSEIKEVKNGEKKLKSAQLGGQTDASSNESALGNMLYQNSPNPFNASTTIEYYLKENTLNAMINIYDMNGTQLQTIPLDGTGYGNITINGGEYNSGMYLYALIADGQVVDTKQMVLTD